MGRGVAAARVLFVAMLVVAPLAPFVVFAEDAAVVSPAPPNVRQRIQQLVGPSDQSVPSIDREVMVVVKLKHGASVPADHGIDIQRVYTREGARLVQGYVSLSSVRELGYKPGIEALRIQQSRSVETGQVARGVETIGADVLHAKGLTGENVTVGIIDRGFRPSDPEIADHVGAYSAFGNETDVGWRHGTAVASVVADTAPDARLHLASVGSTTTTAEYRNAVEWLRASGADVIVDAGSYFGQPGDGSGNIARIAANASDEVVFVTSAGNYAQRHWTGRDNASAGRQWVSFGNGSEGNALADGEPISGRVTVSLHWDEWPTDDDYDLMLFRKRPDGYALVAESDEAQNGSAPVEYLSTTVPRGRYYVSVLDDGAEGVHRLELFANHDLEQHTSASSLTAPATAEPVLTVGAAENGTVAPFSSRGPVGDRTGVDVIAPDTVAATGVEDARGTSYAAPYVAGTVALLYDRYPDLAPAVATAIVRKSATDVGPEGPDPASGYGMLSANRSLSVADARARYAAINETES